MAFAPQDLNVMFYAAGFTLWMYRTPDESVAAPGYFDRAAPYVRTGDLILCVVGDGTASSRIGFAAVRHAESSVDRVTGAPTGRIEIASLATDLASPAVAAAE